MGRLRTIGTRLAARLQKRAARQAPYTIGPGSVVHSEGTIENLSLDSRKVVLGSNTHIRGRLFVFPGGGAIRIGDWSYVGVRTEIWSQAGVTIGNRVLISHGVNIIDTNSHPANADDRHRHYREIILNGHPRKHPNEMRISSAPVVIEDDVWISFGVTILKGVRIGARSIIGAGSVVLQDVPADSTYRNAVVPIIESHDRELLR